MKIQELDNLDAAIECIAREQLGIVRSIGAVNGNVMVAVDRQLNAHHDFVVWTYDHYTDSFIWGHYFESGNAAEAYLDERLKG